MAQDERAKLVDDETVKAVVAGLTAFVVRVGKEKATPEEVRVLPRIARLILDYSTEPLSGDARLLVRK